MKILYGIQPTGKIHLGNYLGGLKQALELQKDHEVTFLIADYHALTTLSRKEVDKLMLQIEVDLHRLGAERVVFQKPDNCELGWEIMCLTPASELKRMTQWKDKGKGNAGLLSYPCLMAADIILSGCDHVLAGKDQVQHFEFYRKVCRRMKQRPAKLILTDTPKIMSIKNPQKKMSKSLGDEHCIYLFDDSSKKIKKAPTTKDGVRNLKIICKGLGIKYRPQFKDLKEEIISKINSITIKN